MPYIAVLLQRFSTAAAYDAIGAGEVPPITRRLCRLTQGFDI
jgi:hypothetical protein